MLRHVSSRVVKWKWLLTIGSVWSFKAVNLICCQDMCVHLCVNSRSWGASAAGSGHSGDSGGFLWGRASCVWYSAITWLQQPLIEASKLSLWVCVCLHMCWLAPSLSTPFTCSDFPITYVHVPSPLTCILKDKWIIYSPLCHCKSIHLFFFHLQTTKWRCFNEVWKISVPTLKIED